jgi:AcrR family transcriptional regulator
MPDQNAKISDVILKAAGVIGERGFEATTMNDICRATGLTKGGLYHYIKGKRDLLYQIMLFGMKHLEESVVEPVSAIDDPEEQLRTLVRLHIQIIALGQGMITILTDEDAGLEPKHRKEILKRKRAYFDFVRGILTALRDQGKLADVNLSVATFNILGQVLFFSRWYAAGGDLKPNDVAEQIAATSLNGVKK